MFRKLRLLPVFMFLYHGLALGQLEQDHVLHFGAGMVSGTAGALVASELSHQNPCWTFGGAVAASLLAGMAKEAIDSGKPGNRWDNADLGATVLGGITVGVTITLFHGKRHRKNGGNSQGISRTSQSVRKRVKNRSLHPGKDDQVKKL